jgi:hypothetical protein
VGTLILDTGAEVSVVSSIFAAAAGLAVTPHTLARRIRTPGGLFSSAGTVSLPLTLQLLVGVEGILMHWDRHLTLHKVWVVDFLTSPPRDLYISYADWQSPTSPLGQLAAMVLKGTKVLNERRVPPLGADPLKVAVVSSGPQPELSALAPDVPLADAILSRIPPQTRLAHSANVGSWPSQTRQAFLSHEPF